MKSEGAGSAAARGEPGGVSQRNSGQAAVEAALVLPLFFFLVLGLFQLTLMHQARLMLEYAAFRAARAGAVSHADPESMRRAAQLALLPVAGQGAVDTPERLKAAHDKAQASSGALRDRLELAVLSPALEDFGTAEEIDFDEPGLAFEQRRRSQLTVRLTWLYELRVPFANALLFHAFMAARRGPVEQAALEQTLRREAASGRYALPLSATWTLRMQSNPFRAHARPRSAGG